uniref:Cuticlin1 [Ceratitis capitata] n=1 Tax=Lepeophtheirus salmonis TaxID=72036 RepID=A0A0K2TE62_LEPSM
MLGAILVILYISLNVVLSAIDVDDSGLLFRSFTNEELLFRAKRDTPILDNALTTSDWPVPPLTMASSLDTPHIKDIQVQCEKSRILVNIIFNRPFNGVIFSKGHFSNPDCVHVPPGSGLLNVAFAIKQNECGTSVSAGMNEISGQPNPAGSYVENIIVVQFDPQVQDVFDQARKLRCTWYDFYEKTISFQPFQVENLNAITANFLGDNLQCWMQIQTGKGPYSSEVSGIVKIGQTLTMVMGIKDEENKFDMLVRNCVAHDGAREPIQLVDEQGCIVREKIMGDFQKIKNFGEAATVVSYAHFQAFKFPDSMNVHFQCIIQVCRFNCPPPNCPTSSNPYISKNLDQLPPVSLGQPLKYNNRQQLYQRIKRSNDDLEGLIATEGVLKVISPRDLALNKHQVDFGGLFKELVEEDMLPQDEDLCLSLLSFSASIIMLLFVSLISSVITLISCSSLNKRSKKMSA